MSGLIGLVNRATGKRAVPVTDPVRILLIDTEPGTGTVLSREIDLDRELAIVGHCSNPARAASEVKRCRPDLVAIRLGFDDERCSALLNALAARDGGPCVVVLGSPSAFPDDQFAEATRLKTRIRAVAEANFGLTPEPPKRNRRLH